MQAFWAFARDMLRYRRLLVLATAAALLDALTAFAGFGLIQGVLRMTFQDQVTLHAAAAEFLGRAEVQNIIGDRTAWAAAIPDDMFTGFVIALLAILPLTAFGATMRFTHQAMAITVSLRTVMRVRQRAYFKMLHLPIETPQTAAVPGAGGIPGEGMESADALSRLISDTARLSKGFSTLMGKAPRDVLMGVAFLAWALINDWQLTAIFLLGLPPIGIAIRKFGKRIRRASKYSLRQYAVMIGAAQESMLAPAVVRLHDAEGYERRRFNTINRRVYRQEVRARTARALSSPVIELIALCGLIAVSLVAAWHVFRSASLQPFDVLMVLAALGVAGMSVKPLANLNNDLQESAAAAERIKQVLDAPAEPNERGQHERDPQPALPRHRREIVFEDVWYRYPGAEAERFAVEAVDLTVAYGQSVAIVGTNGSGKSTLLNLLPRLTEPTRGRVLVDGVDIAGVSLRSLRGQLAAVTQQSVMFAGSIADNLAYGRRHTPREDIIAAAKAASAHGFIMSLPDGYDTKLGEGGKGLSGGQRQRLCIARAILRDPAVLILDEATSQIDAESEAQITEAVNRAKRGRTTFVIAHRLSTVVDCDQIVVMDAGRIVDRGTHEELLGRCAVYQTLVRTQLAA